MAAVPEDLRCKRSDGKQWRCSAPSMPDKTVCEKHYVQAKRRSASSALRASLRRSSSSAAASPAPALPPRSAAPAAAAARLRDEGRPAPLPMAVARPFYGGVAGEAVYVAEPVPAPATARTGVDYEGMPLGNAAGARTAAELVGRGPARSTDTGTAGTRSCHQCQKSGAVLWCSSCDRRGYCAACVSRWYSDIPIDDVQKVCPACRGICNCRVCLQGDNLIKARVQEIPVVDKLRYRHCLLVYVLPVLKQIYSDQCFEIGVETRSSGPKTDILRAKINSDEQMCWKAFEPSLSSIWDPLSIWRGIQEIMDEEMDEDFVVKAVDCSNQSEVNIELKQFIKGYSDGNKGGNDHLLVLKLKEWPQPSVLEEFLLCHRPEFIVNFPLVDFIHPRWGLLNLAAKLPQDALQPELGMRLLISYGSRQEPDKGDSVMNLTINMVDVVFHDTRFPMQVKYPIYDQTVYLNSYHKKTLKDQYGKYYRGHDIFHLQKSTVQLAVNFLSPESLPESVRMAQEIRCLPNGHVAKQKMLEVKKISLYSASSAVREIQRITLDPKFNLDASFEDQNLTRAVSENLARVNKHRKVSCS
nr:unnamed protein product [Digitaria exilis]